MATIDFGHSPGVPVLVPVEVPVLVLVEVLVLVLVDVLVQALVLSLVLTPPVDTKVLVLVKEVLWDKELVP
jgi:hypothetical protein